MRDVTKLVEMHTQRRKKQAKLLCWLLLAGMADVFASCELSQAGPQLPVQP